MKRMAIRFILFLILNFGALALGSLFMGKGATSDWYQSLAKAPWTPPGWVFGFAWFSIMLFLSVYMTKAYELTSAKSLLLAAYRVQLLLNILWNPLFFRWHMVAAALVVIVVLALLVIFIFLRFRDDLGFYSLFILPYILWLLIAISLNAYVSFNN